MTQAAATGAVKAAPTLGELGINLPTPVSAAAAATARRELGLPVQGFLPVPAGMEHAPRIEFHYQPQGDVLEQYILSRTRRTMIMGPLGSGKTNASCWKAFRIMCAQEPNARGIRQTRIVAVRNTYPDLFGTTVKDWLEMFEGLGQFKQGGKEAPTHYIRFQLADGTIVESEMIFMALDREDHVKKLRGVQATAAWVNEAKEIPFSIVSMLDLRMGRYPKEVWPTWYGIFGDTNAPDTDHWYYRMAEEMRPQGWLFLKQAGGVYRKSPNHPWQANPLAENVQNLPRDYYLGGLQGKSENWIKINLANEYGYVGDGLPVHPEYVDSVHCRSFELVPGLPIHIGLDFGLTPAAIIGQRLPNGVWRWRFEVVTTDTGVGRFAGILKRFIAEKCPGYTIASITGDPAGNQKQAGDDEERTVFQILAANGVIAQPAPGNNVFSLRCEAVNKPLRTMIDGVPQFQLHPDCRVTRKGMQGAYKYRRLKVAGEERYEQHPVKNAFSHPCEAGHYLMLGGGEGEVVLEAHPQQRQAEARAYREQQDLASPATDAEALAFRRTYRRGRR